MSRSKTRSDGRQAIAALTACLALTLICAGPQHASAESDGVEALKAMAFEDLFDIEVISVSKRSQKLANAAAAITVLSAEEIRRAGHTSIPEALRMVPGLEVAQIDGNKWAITSRGFNDQYATNLLVLIDGRSVYTPLFSGVFWDVQDVMLEDLDRIEVIRGPGGTLWGANAVNGVINIITKSARDTQGMLATAGAGTLERGFGAARFGGQHGDLHYRVYGKGMARGEMDRRFDGAGAADDWRQGRGGFRMDWNASENDDVTFQGDFYEGRFRQRLPGLGRGPSSGDVRGGNLLARWTRDFKADSQLRMQMFYDFTERREISYEEERNTFDFELQYDRDLLDWLHATGGVNYRVHDTRLQNTEVLIFNPDTREDHLVTGFIQGEAAFFDRSVVVTGGTKIEYNEFSGFEYQPSLRTAWLPSERWTLWAAVSRAVRTPSQANQDLTIATPIGPTTTIAREANNEFDAVDLLAIEIGMRGAPTEHVTVDLAAFYFDYEDVPSSQALPPIITPNPPGPPITTLRTITGNQASGEVYGGEIQIDWRPTERLSFTAIYSVLGLNFQLDGPITAGDPDALRDDSPMHQVKLRAAIDLPFDFEADASVQFVDGLPGQITASGENVTSYWRGDLRIGWSHEDWLAVDLVGQNLFERRHAEFGGVSVAPSLVPRSFFAKLTLRH